MTETFVGWETSGVIGQAWSVITLGDFKVLDPAARLTEPTRENPEFSVAIPELTLSRKDPGDHAKAMIYTNRRFPTGGGLTVSAAMRVRTAGTSTNPYGLDPDDPRLVSGSVALLDDTSGLVLNFEVSNSQILALRELFAVVAPRGVRSDFMPLADPVVTKRKIEAGSWHTYEIRYHPGEDGFVTPGPDRAEWYVDGALVHSCEWVAYIEPPACPVLKPIRFRVGMAVFTLLDNLPDGRGGTIPGPDPNYNHTVFGQGIQVDWKNVQVRWPYE
jgi:hypothetical protein